MPDQPTQCGKGVCDCHVHVIGPKARFPLITPRTYTPPDAPVEACVEMLGRVRAERVVLVQPSIYGEGHGCLMQALAVLGDRARAIAVLPEHPSHPEMDEWQNAGVRGVRLNVATAVPPPLPNVTRELDRLATEVAHRGWHVQILARIPIIESLSDWLCGMAAPVVLDHCCLVPCPARGIPQGWGVLARLLDSGNVWIKLSGAYRLADDGSRANVGRLFNFLVAANPERLLWGSDWPHTPKHGNDFVTDDKESPYQDIDTGELLNSLRGWVASPEVLQKILVDNPSRLYGFS